MEDADMKELEDAMAVFSASCGAIFATKKRGLGFEAIGTCFLMLHNGQPMIVTAAHTFDYAKTLKQPPVVRFLDKAFSLSNCSFAHYPEADFAVSFDNVATEAFEYIRSSEPGAQIASTSEAKALANLQSSINVYCIIGFPCNRNDRHVYKSVHDLKMLRLTTTLVHETPEDLREGWIAMRYDQREFGSLNPRGVSGGPVLRVLFNPINNRLFCHIAGIFIEYHKQRHLLIGCSIGTLLDELAIPPYSIAATSSSS